MLGSPLVAAATPPTAGPVSGAAVVPSTPISSGARVELGFRDGTTTLLHPESAQAMALEELAGLLIRRA